MLLSHFFARNFTAHTLANISTKMLMAVRFKKIDKVCSIYLGCHNFYNCQEALQSHKGLSINDIQSRGGGRGVEVFKNM